MTKDRQRLGREFIAGVIAVTVLALGARACHELLTTEPPPRSVPITEEYEIPVQISTGADSVKKTTKASDDKKKKQKPAARRFLDEHIPNH